MGICLVPSELQLCLERESSCSTSGLRVLDSTSAFQPFSSSLARCSLSFTGVHQFLECTGLPHLSGSALVSPLPPLWSSGLLAALRHSIPLVPFGLLLPSWSSVPLVSPSLAKPPSPLRPCSASALPTSIVTPEENRNCNGSSVFEFCFDLD